MKKMLIPLIILFTISSVFACDVYFDSCQNLNTPNTKYCQNATIPNCGGTYGLIVSADNVTIDCQGYKVIGNIFTVFNPRNSNLYVENCEFNSTSNTGMYIGADGGSTYAENMTFKNSKFIGSVYPTRKYSASPQPINNVTFEDCEFIGGSSGGSFERKCNYWLIDNVTADTELRFGCRDSMIINTDLSGGFRVIYDSVNLLLENNSIINYIWTQQSTGLTTFNNNDYISTSRIYCDNSVSAVFNNSHVNNYALYGNGACNNVNFENTNMTGYTRGISRDNALNKFRYRENGVYLVSDWDSSTNINRLLQVINQSQVKWNDTGSGIGSYDLSGLYPDQVYKIYDNGGLHGSNTTDGSGVLPTFYINLASEHEIDVQECDPNWNMTSNTTVCYNSTHLINEVNYTDLNTCSDDYTDTFYPVLQFTLSSNVTSCFNSTTRLVNETYTDTFGCNESFEVLTYTNVPNATLYECVGAGVFNYTGSCC
jgi:hypothetical protein